MSLRPIIVMQNVKQMTIMKIELVLKTQITE